MFTYSRLMEYSAPDYNPGEALRIRWIAREVEKLPPEPPNSGQSHPAQIARDNKRAEVQREFDRFKAGASQLSRAFVVELLPELQHYDALMADDRPIRNLDDAKAWLGDLWEARGILAGIYIGGKMTGGYWLQAIAKKHPGAKGARNARDVYETLRAGNGDYKRGPILLSIAGQIGNAQAYQTWVNRARLNDLLLEVYDPPTFEEANLAYAGEMLADAPAEFVKALAQQYGVKQDNDANMRGAVAFKVAFLATSHGRLLPEIILEYERQGTLTNEKHGTIDAVALLEEETGATPPQVSGAGGNFFKDLGKALQKIFVTAPGRVIRDLGKEMLRGRKNIPWLGKFVLDPLGISAQAVFLEELGNAAVDGSISTFNEARFGKAAGQTFVAAGQALAVAAPFLPVPFNVAAAALAAASIALGKFTLEAIARQEAATKLEREEAKAEEKAEAAERQAQEAKRTAEEQAARDAEYTEKLLAAEAPGDGKRGRVLVFTGTAAAAAIAVVSALVFWR